MGTLLIIGLILLVIIVFWVWGSRPARYKSEREALESHLRSLFVYGDDGYALWVLHEGFNTLAFRKCVDGARESIKCTFPLTMRLKSHAEKVKETFNGEGIEYEEVPISGKDSKYLAGLINVNDIISPEEAFHVANLVLDVVGFDGDEQFTVYFKGYLKPEYNSIKEIIKRYKKPGRD